MKIIQGKYGPRGVVESLWGSVASLQLTTATGGMTRITATTCTGSKAFVFDVPTRTLPQMRAALIKITKARPSVTVDFTTPARQLRPAYMTASQPTQFGMIVTKMDYGTWSVRDIRYTIYINNNVRQVFSNRRGGADWIRSMVRAIDAYYVEVFGVTL